MAGPTPDVIYVLVQDSTTCTADDISPLDLQHVVGLRLGPAENLSAILPREELHLSLCENSLRPTLIADRRVYWAEVTSLLQRWQNVNDTGCPHCHRIIRVNMSRHLRASHTDNQCFWRCPVSTCPMWFSSELNGKDHLERIHSFREGQGCSFYECLRKYGMEWFGKRLFFDQRDQSSQAMWINLALARQSGQELSNHYVITNSPVMAHLRLFFHAAVRCLTSAYENIATAQVLDSIGPSLCDRMRQEIADNTEEFDPSEDQASGYDTQVRSTPTPPPVVETPRRSITPNNRSLAVMAPQCHLPLARGAVSSSSIASMELQTFVEPLPLDQLLCHTPSTVQTWPTTAREEILAVAHRDLAVARRNIADFTYYLDVHAVHLSACAGALDDTVPLMSAETFPRLPGGIRSALREIKRDQ